MNPLDTAEARLLHRSRPDDPFANRSARLARRSRRQLPRSHGRHLHMQVDAVHQRTRNAPHITVHRPRRTGALLRRVVVIAARAGIHRRHERKIRRVFDVVSGPRNHDLLLLQRLPQHFEHAAPEFGQLIEEQHAVVGQRHLARPGRLPAADHGDLRSRMMRSAKRPPGHQPARHARLARHGVYLGRFERLFARKRRQDRRQTPCEHRLARTRRTDHDDVVPSRRRDLQRAFHMHLAPHVGEILRIVRRRRIERFVVGRHGRRNLRLAVQVSDDLAQGRGADHLDAVDNRGLRRVFHRQHHPPQPLRTRPDRNGKHAPHGFERAVERQFADEHRPGDRPGVDAAHRREDSHGDRQVETRPLLAQVGRSEAHDHLLARHPLARVLERRPDALFALLHGIVGQSHEVHAQTAAGDVDLDGHRHGVDPGDRSCKCTNEHG